MSRGPGSFQQDILDRIQRNRHQAISWVELRDCFPLRLQNRSLHRAVRSLIRMRRLREIRVDGKRWFVYCSPRGMSKAEREWVEACKKAAWYLRKAAKARGVVVPVEAAKLDAVHDAVVDGIVDGVVDAYQRQFS